METLLPPSWPRPKGYSNGISATGRMIFTAGLVGWDETETFVAKDIAGQARQAFENIVAVLAAGDAKPEHIVRMTWYVADKQEYLGALKEIGEAYRNVIGRHFPAMAAVQVAGLIEDEARLEIEVTAVVPD